MGCCICAGYCIHNGPCSYCPKHSTPPSYKPAWNQWAQPDYVSTLSQLLSNLYKSAADRERYIAKLKAVVIEARKTSHHHSEGSLARALRELDEYEASL